MFHGGSQKELQDVCGREQMRKKRKESSGEQNEEAEEI